jgi:DICT domain-containing protein
LNDLNDFMLRNYDVLTVQIIIALMAGMGLAGGFFNWALRQNNRAILEQVNRLRDMATEQISMLKASGTDFAQKIGTEVIYNTREIETLKRAAAVVEERHAHFVAINDERYSQINRMAAALEKFNEKLDRVASKLEVVVDRIERATSDAECPVIPRKGL